MESSSDSGLVAFQVERRQTVTISDLPSCALAPAINIIGKTGCGTDIACVCKISNFFSSFTAQIQAACSTADFAKAIVVGDQLCSQAGVTIVSAYASGASTFILVSALPTSSLNTSAPAMTTSSVSGSGSLMTTSYPSTSPSAVIVTITLAGPVSRPVSISTVSELAATVDSMASTSVPTSANDGQSLSSGVIAGIAVGIAISALVILSLLLWYLILSPRRKKRILVTNSHILPPKESPSELYGSEWPLRQEMHG